MAKKHSFFLWQSNPPKKKQKWDFAIKMVILHSTPWKTWDFFFTFQPLGFHQQEDMIGVYWYAANRLDFLSVDINHLPFTINQFFYGFYIYLWDITVYWYVWSVLMIQTTRLSVTGMMDIVTLELGIPKWRDIPAIFRLVNCSLTRIYADVLS